MSAKYVLAGVGNVELIDKASGELVATSKTLVNILVNIGLGSLWNSMMYGKAFLYYASISIVKNLVLLPFEIIAFYIIYKALEPITKKYLH